MGFEADRTQLIQALEKYNSDYEVEAAFRSRFLALIQDHSNCFERELKHAHITGSAWILDESRTYALMTHHAKLDKWLQLGGHADGDANVRRVALREANEESGLASVKLLSEKILDLDIHPIPARKDEPEHEHFDIRYLFQADMEELIQSNHESKEISWIPLSKLDELTGGNRSILRMAEKTFQN